ncbi:MAG: hypothetical protein LBS72_06985 [Oscillospiraceae bacterium]|nr:hypothetical protein [Oscillospiraceae bacterium]
MNANPDLLEKIEYLREKADIGYEEALTLLERFDGDMTRILIELERSNKLRKEPEPASDRASDYSYQYTHSEHAKGGAHFDQHHHQKRHEGFEKVMTVLFKNHLQITRGSEILVNLPVACYALFVLFAPHLSFFALIAMFLLGCRIRRSKRPGAFRQEDVQEFVGKTAKNIRTTFDSVSQTIRNETQPKDSPESDEGGEYTVE